METGASPLSSSYGYLDLPRNEILAFLPPGIGALLDVGCGLGGFGQAAKRQRPDLVVVGLESDPTAAAVATGRLDAVVVGSFPGDVPDDGGPFDCISFLDVLEHLADPWSALRAAAALAPQGVVLASIPNVRYWPVAWRLLRYGEFTYQDSGVLDRSHLRFFTRTSILELFVSSGFDVLELHAVNPLPLATLGLPERLVLKLLEQVRRRAAADLCAQQYVVLARPA